MSAVSDGLIHSRGTCQSTFAKGRTFIIHNHDTIRILMCIHTVSHCLRAWLVLCWSSGSSETCYFAAVASQAKKPSDL
jgi:hypothetical protein